MNDKIFTAAVRHYVQNRSETEEPISPDELLSFADGSLPREQRERFFDRLSMDPEMAREAADLVHFSQLEPPEEEARSAEELEADWAQLRTTLAADERNIEAIEDPLPDLGSTVKALFKHTTKILTDSPGRTAIVVGTCATLFFWHKRKTRATA